MPDAARLLRPSLAERAIAYTLVPLGGVALGGLAGGLEGQRDAVARVMRDEAASARIDKCWMRVTGFADEGEARRQMSGAAGAVGATLQQRLAVVRAKAVVGMLGAFRGTE